MSPAPPLYPLLTVFRVISSSFRVYSPLQANNVQTYRHTNVYIDIQIFSGLFSYTCKQYSWTYRHTNIYIDIQIFPVIFSYTCKQYSDIQTYIYKYIHVYIYIYIVFSTFFSLNIHFRCLNIYFFQDKMFHGSNPIIIWNKTLCIYRYIYNTQI